MKNPSTVGNGTAFLLTNLIQIIKLLNSIYVVQGQNSFTPQFNTSLEDALGKYSSNCKWF